MAQIERADIEAAIQEDYNYDLLNTATASSTALSVFDPVPMGAKVQNMPALATRPTASWVGETAETRTKPTSKFSFENKTLTAAEVAVIVVMNEEDLEDINDDLLGKTAALGGEAIGRALDEAVLFGIGKPAAWGAADLFAQATADGNVLQIGAGPGADDLVGAILQGAETIDDSGANPAAFLARKGLRYRLANLRDSSGAPIYSPSLASAPGGVDQVAGLDTFWNANGAWQRDLALGLIVDPAFVRLGVRSDISVKFLDQATVGGVSLAENDQVALRFRARYAYTVANITGTEGSTLQPVAAVTEYVAPAA